MKVTPKKRFNPQRGLKERNEEKRKLMDVVTDDLENQGVVFFKPTDLGGTLDIDVDYISLPRDMTDLPSHELGKYMNAFTQQKMYMRTLMGWQKLKVAEISDKYLTKFEDIYVKTTKENPKMSEKSKESICNSHPTVKPLFEILKNEERKLNIIEDNIDSITDALFNISREITRKEADFNLETRNYNVGNKRKKY